MPDIGIPGLERLTRLRMRFPKLPEHFPGYYSHDEICIVPKAGASQVVHKRYGFDCSSGEMRKYNSFDAVAMMREIRTGLSKKYLDNPEPENLEKIRKQTWIALKHRGIVRRPRENRRAFHASVLDEILGRPELIEFGEAELSRWKEKNERVSYPATDKTHTEINHSFQLHQSYNLGENGDF
jgi:hypothetical protein